MPLRLPAPILVFLLAAAVLTLVVLGTWQVQRGIEKGRLTAERNAQLAGQPLSAGEARTRTAAALDYRLVALDGTWDAAHPFILANQARYGRKGEEVLVPLVIAPGEAVLVNRGWYPEGERERTLGRLSTGQTSGLQGLALDAGDRTARRTAAGTWTGTAPASMGADLPYRLLPWIVVEGKVLPAHDPVQTTYPAQGFLPYTSETPHTEYAITWYGLALTLVVIAVARFVVEPRRRRAAARG